MEAAMSDKCERCGDTIVVPNRFNVRAYDFTESTGAFVEGRLCSYCWDDLMAFFSGAELADEASPVVRCQVAKRNRRETLRRRPG